MLMILQKINSSLLNDTAKDMEFLAEQMQFFSQHDQNKAIILHCCELILPLCTDLKWVDYDDEIEQMPVTSAFVGLVGWMIHHSKYQQAFDLLEVAQQVFQEQSAQILQILAKCLYSGDVLKKDRYIALHLFKKAADLELKASREVTKTHQQQEQAIKTLTIFAQDNNIFAARHLALEFDSHKDKTIQDHWINISAQAGFSDAQARCFNQYLLNAQRGQREDYFAVGRAYANGLGVLKDQAQAIMWLGKVKDDNIAACMQLCAITLSQDPMQTLETIKQARTVSDLQTLYVSACCMEKGLFTDVDKMGALAMFYDLLDANFGFDVMDHVLVLDDALHFETE